MTILNTQSRKTLLYIAIAFAFSVAMRLIWISYFSNEASFHFHDQLMINTNDGCFRAEGARDPLAGPSANPDANEFFDRFHQPNDLSSAGEAAAQLTALFVKILPFSFEMPSIWQAMGRYSSSMTKHTTHSTFSLWCLRTTTRISSSRLYSRHMPKFTS